MFSIIWFYVDKYQQSQEPVKTKQSQVVTNGKQASSSGVQTRSQSHKSQSVVVAPVSEEESKGTEVLAERRAKKRELLMKMTAPDRIEEDPLQEEQLATARESPNKKQVTPAKKVEEVKVAAKAAPAKTEASKKKKKTPTAPKVEEPEVMVVPELKKIVEVASLVVLENDEWNVVSGNKYKK